MDNKSYPLELKNITKKKDNYQLVVATSIDLKQIKNKHRFTTQRFVGELKNKKFDEQNFYIDGSLEVENQHKINNLYYHTINLKIRNKNNIGKLTELDTISGYLQLSYANGRTYPTKSVDIPVAKILELQ